MDNIKTGIRKPKEDTRETAVGKSIEYGVTTPSSSYDQRPDVGTASYIGDSKMEGRSSALAAGTKQSKKHRSTGKGQN